MKLLFILLQAEGSQTGSQWGFWGMMILIFIIMWIFMIRPQQKKQKELERKRNEMKPGDHVVTAGGIHGKIEKIQETTMTIEIAKGVSIKVDKSSVFEEPQPEEKKEDKPVKEESKEVQKKSDE